MAKKSTILRRLGRRFGRPRTDAERRRRHKALFGTSKLPPRGTGLKRSGII